MRNFLRSIARWGSDESFLMGVKKVETLAAKVMSIAMVVIILIAVAELCLFIGQEILFSNAITDPNQFSTVTLIKVFGLFLNVLIALEVMENITAYLKKHGVQLELVIVTSLTAVARKIIIFDFSKSSGNELMALAIAILTLSISYWIVRRGAH
ncbi:MAG TPA: phosphate-starvation-inducible PsiE family protein [Coleofasciculaceae cyanobacterium]